jgi:hypothetical protein
MTPTEIRTALEAIVLAYDAYRGRGVRPAPGEYAAVVAAIKHGRALLAALPGETVPVKVDVSREWCEQATRDEAATGDPDCTTGRPSGDTAPAPPRALVEVVREWQDAHKGWRHEGRPTWTADVAVCDRCAAAEVALLNFPLPAPEAPETPSANISMTVSGHSNIAQVVDALRLAGYRVAPVKAPETPR